MPWTNLSVLSRHPELVEEVLIAQGAQSVSFLDAADNPVLEPAPGETPLWPLTRTVGLFAVRQKLAPIVATLREILPDGAAAIITSAALDEQEWVKVWLRDWKPLKFGKHLWVTPQAKRREIRDRKAVIVRLDPGLAFGTGTHPSTALCLEWLARAELKGKTVLDYGCGSGLLAIAALKLGALRATAVDIDPQALIATRDNAQRNSVGGRLKIVQASGLRLGTFDVVLANILANPLIELAPRLGERVAAGGHLVLSGLLARQADEVMAAYTGLAGRGFAFQPPALSQDWARLEGHHRADQKLRTATFRRRKS